MGWWIADNDGGIKVRKGRSLMNVLPGEKLEEDVVGDEPADAMDNALLKIRRIYYKAFDREPRPTELCKLFMFCMKGVVDKGKVEVKYKK